MSGNPNWYPLGGNQYIAPPSPKLENFSLPATYGTNNLVPYQPPSDTGSAVVLAATITGVCTVLVAAIGVIGIAVSHWLHSQSENSERCNEANRRFESAMGLQTSALRRDGLNNYKSNFRGCNSGNDQDIDRALADLKEHEPLAPPPVNPPQINVYGGTANFYGVNQPSAPPNSPPPNASVPLPDSGTLDPLEITLPQRWQTYSLTPKRYYTTTYQVISGTVVVDAGIGHAKLKCSSGDSFHLFWKNKPEFALSSQETEVKIQIMEIQKGAHLSGTSCVSL